MLIQRYVADGMKLMSRQLASLVVTTFGINFCMNCFLNGLRVNETAFFAVTFVVFVRVWFTDGNLKRYRQIVASKVYEVNFEVS